MGRNTDGIYNFFERFFDGLRNRYDRTLQIVMRHRFTTLMLSFAILVATLFLFYVIPKGFFPDEDTGQIFAITEAAQDISFDAMSAHQQAAAKIVAADTNVDGFMSAIGAGGSSASLNHGRLFMRLKPRSERKLRREPDHPGTAPEAGANSGLQRVYAKPAAHPHRRQPDQGAVSIQPCRTPTPRSFFTGRRY